MGCREQPKPKRCRCLPIEVATEHEGEYHASFSDDGVGGGIGGRNLGRLAREPEWLDG